MFVALDAFRLGLAVLVVLLAGMVVAGMGTGRSVFAVSFVQKLVSVSYRDDTLELTGAFSAPFEGFLQFAVFVLLPGLGQDVVFGGAAQASALRQVGFRQERGLGARSSDSQHVRSQVDAALQLKLRNINKTLTQTLRRSKYYFRYHPAEKSNLISKIA